MSKQLHQRKRSEASLSDEYETPKELFNSLCNQYIIYPDTDVCATDDNSKCTGFVDKKIDCLTHNFQYHDEGLWCNPPQTKCKEFVKKMNDSWKEWNIPIIMIIPANVLTTDYFHQVINNVEYYPIFGRITFLYNGKPSPYPARNGYFVVIWRKRI